MQCLAAIAVVGQSRPTIGPIVGGADKVNKLLAVRITGNFGCIEKANLYLSNRRDSPLYGERGPLLPENHRL
jgi:hypothetical protein